jgi:predicted RNase H-like nuclease (RuvC/YqgF family)
LQIYRLSSLESANAAERKAKLNDVLSLVQAALEAQGSGNNMLMKVHEATGTLIYRGNAAQIEVVQRALKALEPTADERENFTHRLRKVEEDYRDEYRSMVSKMTRQLEELEHENSELRKLLKKQSAEMEDLKAHLAPQGR